MPVRSAAHATRAGEHQLRRGGGGCAGRGRGAGRAPHGDRRLCAQRRPALRARPHVRRGRPGPKQAGRVHAGADARRARRAPPRGAPAARRRSRRRGRRAAHACGAPHLWSPGLGMLPSAATATLTALCKEKWALRREVGAEDLRCTAVHLVVGSAGLSAARIIRLLPLSSSGAERCCGLCVSCKYAITYCNGTVYGRVESRQAALQKDIPESRTEGWQDDITQPVILSGAERTPVI